jgi:hypothetical protein
MRHWLARALAVIGLATGLVATPVRAADDWPRLPCGVEPLPAFAEPGKAPNIRSWVGKAARGWKPPACIDWEAVDPDMMVALAGSFAFDGDFDGLLARVGAISATKGVRYWSTTEKSWQPLVTDAYALSGPDPALRRADFAPAQITKGQSLYYAQSDNRSSGKTVYRARVVAAGSERLVVEFENATPVKMAIVTMFDAGGAQTVYFIERRSPGAWNFYSLTRTRMASSLLPAGSDASYINRSLAFFRFVAGIPTDLEPPAAR